MCTPSPTPVRGLENTPLSGKRERERGGERERGVSSVGVEERPRRHSNDAIAKKDVGGGFGVSI